MKVISGKYKGRNLLGYTLDKTRPTQDRVKESMFASIQNDLQESRVLDLFAGSGNLGIESLSNGATHVTFVDYERAAIQILERNLRDLSVDPNRFTVYHSEFQKALEIFKKNQVQFDLVFLDPPYQLDVIPEILIFLTKESLLAKDAIVVCEFEHPYEMCEVSHLYLWKEKKFGYKYVNFYQFQKEEEK